MDWTLVSWAFLAGAAATVNPCGIAMLPAYVSYYLGNGDSRASPVRGFQVGLLLSVGVLVVFASVGLVIAAIGTAIARFVPWLALLIGVALLVAGVSTLIGRAPALTTSGAQRAPADRGAFSSFTFGVGYGMASLGCTLPIFMIVASTVLSAGFGKGLAAFVAYGLGMGAVLGGIAVVVALGKTAAIRTVRTASGALKYIGGVGLLAAGSYLIYYNLGGLQLFYGGEMTDLPAYLAVAMFILSLLAVVTLKRFDS